MSAVLGRVGRRRDLPKAPPEMGLLAMGKDP